MKANEPEWMELLEKLYDLKLDPEEVLRRVTSKYWNRGKKQEKKLPKSVRRKMVWPQNTGR